jgi:RsiW-degrading membrane proteinase PrsW (M82 family)
MNVWYKRSLMAMAVAMATVVWILFSPYTAFPLGLVLAAASVLVAVLFAVAGRVEQSPLIRSLIGGATIGVGIALASHAVVTAFAYFFFLDFAEAATEALDALRIDPEFTAVLSSPWTLFYLIELAVVAPITEESGKALGAFLGRPKTRRDALLAGVAAGVGFAVVENVLYGFGALFYAWEPVVLGRMLGAAVHPLASGLVVLGWWELRHGGERSGAIRRILAGVGTHAAWNGSLVIASVAGIAYDNGGASGVPAVLSLVYVGVIGVISAAGLWRLTTRVAGDGALPDLAPTDGRVLTAWAILASSLLIPVAVLVIAFPDFV